MECNLSNHQRNSIIPNWAIAGAISIALPLGVNTLAPSAAVAVSTTWGETITLSSILAGYESVLLGLDEIGMGGELNLGNPFVDFADGFASLSVTGTIGGMEFALDGQGVLAGEVGSADLDWTGNWLGTLAGEFILADDLATFVFDGTDGYTQLDFSQSGEKVFFDSWVATKTGTLTSGIGGSQVLGWSGPGKGTGIGGEVSTAMADWQTEFLDSSNLSNSSLLVDGDNQSYELTSDALGTIVDNNYACGIESKCEVPEPSPTGGILFLLTLGIIRQVGKLKIFKVFNDRQSGTNTDLTD